MGIEYVERKSIDTPSELREFCWSGACSQIEDLSNSALKRLIDHISEIFADQEEEVTDTEINDYIWFEPDEWHEAIGLIDEDNIEDAVGDDLSLEVDGIVEEAMDAMDNEEFDSEVAEEVAREDAKSKAVKKIVPLVNDWIEEHDDDLTFSPSEKMITSIAERLVEDRT